MDARTQPVRSQQPHDPAQVAQVAGEQWLLAQAKKAGFEIQRGQVDAVGDDGLLETVEHCALRIDGYRQHRLPRKGASFIQFSTLDYEGVLIVRDPELFMEKVAKGFGPQKAFGCGLMLLRRA